MHDTSRRTPDHAQLFDLASEHGGQFTAAEASRVGFGTALLSHHVKTGRFLRLARGVYRLRDYPTYPHEDVMTAWLSADPEVAVVSHESALELLGLSDVVPSKVHITLPRRKRYRSPSPGLAIHTTTRRFGKAELTTRGGMRVTAPGRAILDAAEGGTAPEQIEMAVSQAIARGQVGRSQLLAAARRRGSRVHDLVRNALEAART